MAANVKQKASISEFKCAICLQILIEPVVLPCKHEMCRPCFRKNVEEANFLCPMCRKRIASWARKCMREGTLVDEDRWRLIQKRFPDKCLKRLKGEDDDSEDESYFPPPKRILAKAGELRLEYEEEMNKVLEIQQQEEQASKNLIEHMLKEEQALLKQHQNQAKEDEQLARTLSQEVQQTQGRGDASKLVGNGLKTPIVSSKKKCKRMKTLDKYFCLKDKHSGNSSAEGNSKASDQQSYRTDYELAKALQKQFDEEAVAANKRDDYLLRNTTLDKEHEARQEK